MSEDGVVAEGLRRRFRGHVLTAESFTLRTQSLVARIVRQESQVMRRMTTVIARPISGSAISTPSVTVIALATTASDT